MDVVQGGRSMHFMFLKKKKINVIILVSHIHIPELPLSQCILMIFT